MNQPTMRGEFEAEIRQIERVFTFVGYAFFIAAAVCLAILILISHFKLVVLMGLGLPLAILLSWMKGD